VHAVARELRVDGDDRMAARDPEPQVPISQPSTWSVSSKPPRRRAARRTTTDERIMRFARTSAGNTSPSTTTGGRRIGSGRSSAST
jgi:hypothetical protein